MTNPLVIDISHWNDEPDWAKLKANGTVGVIIKATEGTGYVDDTYGKRQVNARAAGLLTATYHFLKHGNVSTQMENYLRAVGPEEGDRMVIDYEDPDCTFEDLEQAVEYLLAGGDVEVAVYGSNKLTEDVAGKSSEILRKTSLWQARYSTSQPKVPTNIWTTWSLWQYTQSETPAGCTGGTDCNKWNGDPAKLADWFKRPGSQPVPTPVPDDNVATVSFDIKISSDKPIKVNVTINGEPVEV